MCLSSPRTAPADGLPGSRWRRRSGQRSAPDAFGGRAAAIRPRDEHPAGHSDRDPAQHALAVHSPTKGASPWNPEWASHKASALAAAAGVKLNIKGLRHYRASQLLAARFDLRNTAARLGHGSGGATTLRHYADPVSEVDRRAAAYLAQLTAGSGAQSD